MWKRIIALGLFAAMLFVGATGYSALKAPAAASGPIQSVALQTASASDQALGVSSNSTVYEIQTGASHASFQLTTASVCASCSA